MRLNGASPRGAKKAEAHSVVDDRKPNPIGYPSLEHNGVPAGANWFVGDAAIRGMYSGTVRTQNRTLQIQVMKRTMKRTRHLPARYRVRCNPRTTGYYREA